MDQVNQEIFIVDCDLMVRQWSLSTSTCIRSYMLQTRRDQMNEINDDFNQEHDPEGYKHQKRIQLAKSDKHRRFLMICFEGGEIQVNNFYTGALIYNNFNVDTLKFENEVAQAEFFTS